MIKLTTSTKPINYVIFRKFYPDNFQAKFKLIKALINRGCSARSNSKPDSTDSICSVNLRNYSGIKPDAIAWVKA